MFIYVVSFLASWFLCCSDVRRIPRALVCCLPALRQDVKYAYTWNVFLQPGRTQWALSDSSTFLEHTCQTLVLGFSQSGQYGNPSGALHPGGSQLDMLACVMLMSDGMWARVFYTKWLGERSWGLKCLSNQNVYYHGTIIIIKALNTSFLLVII